MQSNEQDNSHLKEVYPFNEQTKLYNFRNMSVDEVLQKYQHNPQLLHDILIIKAEEDKRRVIEECYQAEQARLQSNMIDYRVYQNTSVSDNGFNSNIINTSSSATQNTRFDRSVNNGQHNVSFFLDNSSMILNGNNRYIDPMYGYSLPQDNQSKSSVIPTSPHGSEPFGYNDNQTMLSVSPIDVDVSSALPSPTNTHPYFFQPYTQQSPNRNMGQLQLNQEESSSSSKTKPNIDSPTKNIRPNVAIIKSKSGRSIAHKTLSYENVMNLEEYNTKIMNELQNKPNKENNMPPSPSLPLDHGKVMEALREKLKKSSSSQVRHRHSNSSPENSTSAPSPPPPNTFPTSGVLLLDLNKRKRKNTIKKRKDHGKYNRSNSMP